MPERRRPMTRGRHWLLAVLSCSGAIAASARQSVALDDSWRFQQGDTEGASRIDFDDTRWTSVALPHTWNAVDGEAGGAYYRGAGWYRRSVVLPEAAAPRRYFLWLAPVNITACCHEVPQSQAELAWCATAARPSGSRQPPLCLAPRSACSVAS